MKKLLILLTALISAFSCAIPAYAWHGSGVIEPGIGFIGLEGRNYNRCTLGWIIADLPHQEVYGLTAGHCDPYNHHIMVVWPHYANGHVQPIPVGHFVKAIASRLDYALIHFDYKGSPYVRGEGLGRVITTQQLIDTTPILCKMGDTTNETCGRFIGIDRSGKIMMHLRAESGDSGSPVYVRSSYGLLGAGILDSVDDSRGIAWATPLDTILYQTHMKFITGI